MEMTNTINQKEIERMINLSINEMLKKQKDSLYEKEYLTLNQASKYFGIGLTNLRKYVDKNCEEVILYVGTKRLIRRAKLKELLEEEQRI